MRRSGAGRTLHAGRCRNALDPVGRDDGHDPHSHDVRFEALLPQTCNRRASLSTISFFASGMSCGGAIALTRLDAGYDIRVNWLTGRIEIVSRSSTTN